MLTVSDVASGTTLTVTLPTGLPYGFQLTPDEAVLARWSPSPALPVGPDCARRLVMCRWRNYRSATLCDRQRRWPAHPLDRAPHCRPPPPSETARRAAGADCGARIRVAAAAAASGRVAGSCAVFRRVLIPVRYLVDGQQIAQLNRETVTYWHVELDRHDVILADGLPVESYLDTGDRSNFVNGGDAIALYPDFSSRSGNLRHAHP